MRGTYALVLLACGFGLAGCTSKDLSLVLGTPISSFPGTIKTNTSNFDGTQEVTMTPAFVYRKANGFSGSDLELGMFWNSQMGNNIQITAIARHITSIEGRNGLLFNVDGKIVALSSSRALTSFSGGVSYRRFDTTIDFVEKMLAAKNVKVRLDMDDTFVEGVLTDTTTSSAYNGFKATLEKIKAIHSQEKNGS